MLLEQIFSLGTLNCYTEKWESNWVLKESNFGNDKYGDSFWRLHLVSLWK